jgi:hypothetical protein
VEALETLGFKFQLMDSGKYQVIDPYPEIEMSSLEELACFVDKWGDVIITANSDGHELEIYNNYRE